MKNPEITESNVQYVSMWKVLAGDRPNADLTDRPGLSMCWADSPFPFWNAVFLTEEISDATLLRDRLNEASRYVGSKRHDGLIYICEDYLLGQAKKDLDAILASEKLQFALDITGMVGDILPLASPTYPSSLKFLRVTDEAALQLYADINSEGYGFPLDAGRAGLGGSRFWKETAFAYIGYEDGKAVSTASAIVNGGQLYLALVATRPDAQRRGFGAATVRHALQAAYDATGLRRTTLHATDAGFPVYQRVGYHRTTKFMTYTVNG
jgi:GNAT superfamily N-acetyltransferase